MASTRKKRMANRSQQPVQVNGLYVHASPPRVVQMNPSIMRQWLRGGDLDKLEQVVLEGQGSRLVGEYSADPKTRAFIRSVPSLMSKIDAAHAATSRGQLKELQDLIAGEKRIQLALAKDRSGVGLLHKAVFQDHGNIIEWLIRAYPATVNSKDREGRSSLHYCGAGSDAQYTWRTLIEAGADPQQADVRGRVPAYYMDNPDDLRLPASPADSEDIRRITAAREGLIVKPSNIRIWIHDQDLGRLKQVLWEGHGNRLRTETSKYPAVKRFLDFVPYAMNAIRDTHAAAISGDREAFQNRTSEPAPVDLLMSKDSNGLTPLHKSAGLGNVGVTDEILRRAPRATIVTDNFGRTSLHYSVLLKDQGEMYNTLIREGADELAVDNLGRSAEYYRGRPGDLDSSLLRNIPEAPRTSSIFPPSWDWNVLATDGSISNQTSGASRRPRKTSRTSGATRSDGGGSPLDEAPSTNGPVNGQDGTEEDRPKTSDNDDVTSADIQPSDNSEDYPAGNERLDSQTSSAADGVLDEQQARIMTELFPEFRTFLRRLSDLGEIYEREGLGRARSPIKRSNSEDETMRLGSLSAARTSGGGNQLRVPDIRVDSPVASHPISESRIVGTADRIGLEDWFNDAEKTERPLPGKQRGRNTASKQKDNSERSNVVASAEPNISTAVDTSLDRESPGGMDDSSVIEHTIRIQDRLSNDSDAHFVDSGPGEESFETENLVPRPGIFRASDQQDTNAQMQLQFDIEEGPIAIRESDRQEIRKVHTQEPQISSKAIPQQLRQAGNQIGILKTLTQFSDRVDSKENGDQFSKEGHIMNTKILLGLSSENEPVTQNGVLVSDADGINKSHSEKESLRNSDDIRRHENSVSRAESNDMGVAINQNPTKLRTAEVLLEMGETKAVKHEVLQSNGAMVEGELTTALFNQNHFQKIDDVLVNANEHENTEKRQWLPDLMVEVVNSSEDALETDHEFTRSIRTNTGGTGNSDANMQDGRTELAVLDNDSRKEVLSVVKNTLPVNKAENGRDEREVYENKDLQKDMRTSVLKQELVTSMLDVSVSDNGPELNNQVVRMEQLDVQNTHDTKEVANFNIHQRDKLVDVNLQAPEEQDGFTDTTTNLTLVNNVVNKKGAFPEEGETSLDGKILSTDIISNTGLQESRDPIHRPKNRDLAQDSYFTLSEGITGTDFATDKTIRIPTDISIDTESSIDRQVLISQVIPSLNSPSLEDKNKVPLIKTLAESAGSPIEKESTDDIQEYRSTALKDEMRKSVTFFGTQNESLGLIDELIGGHQSSNDSFSLPAYSRTSQVNEPMRNEVNFRGVAGTEQVASCQSTRSDMNQSANDNVFKSLKSEGGSGGSEQNHHNMSPKIRNSMEYNSSAVIYAHVEQDGLTASGSVSKDFSKEQAEQSQASLRGIAEKGNNEEGIQTNENDIMDTRVADVGSASDVPRDAQDSNKRDGDPKINVFTTDKNTDELKTDTGAHSDQIENSEVGLGNIVVLNRESETKILTKAQSSQLQTAVEETAGRIEEESKEKTDGETPLEEPPQTDDGVVEPPSGLPDETPIRSESQLDGDKLDDDVPPTPTNEGEPTNDTDGAANESGEGEQSAESNDLTDQPKSANEIQETAPKNVNSEEDSDVKDEVPDNVEKRDKRSVDDNTIDEDGNSDNVPVANGIPSADDIPSANDIAADIDVTKPEDSSPPLDIQAIQDILANDSSTSDIPTTDSIPTDDIPSANDIAADIDVTKPEGSSPSLDIQAIQDILANDTSTSDIPTTDSIPIDDIPSANDIAADIDVPNPEDNSPPLDTQAIQEILTNDTSTSDIPTTDSIPTTDDIPATDADLPEKIDDLSGDTEECDTNLPSNEDVIDIPSVVVDSGSADENQYDDPGEEGAAVEGSVPDAEVEGEVPPPDTEIPKGDVNRDEGKDAEDPPDDPKEASEQTAEQTWKDVAHQEVEDASNPAEDEPLTMKSGDDVQFDNKDDSENNNRNSKDVSNEIDGNGSEEEMIEDLKGDGDNNDVEEMDKEAPGTPDSIDVVSGDRSSDENEEEDTSDRTNVGDPSSRGSDAHNCDGGPGLEPSTGNDTEENSGMGVGDGSQSTAEENSGLEIIENSEPNEKESPTKIAETEANPGAAAGATIGVDDGSGVAPGEGSRGGDVEGASEGVISNADQTPQQVGNGRIPHAETNNSKAKSSKRLSFRGITRRVLNGLSRRSKADDIEDTIDVSNGLSEQERKCEDGDTAKGEGLSNATTAIIGAQSSPDTINTDDFQETDSRLYRSSRRPQTPLPAPSTVLTEQAQDEDEDQDQDQDERVNGDEEEEEHSKRRGLVSHSNGDGARNLQGRVIGERNMDNQAAASNIAKGDGPRSGPPKPDPEVERLIARGDLSALAELVLNGEGNRLVGRRSEMPELQSFIENVPTYMAKIRSVHDSARSGQLRELQAALDRRKFAVARDPRTAAGATPLHAAVLLGQTAVVRYLAGRFPETLAARDARGRAPLHCAAALPDNGHYFNLLLNLGADRTLKDNNGRTASYYMQNPGVLTHKQLLADINAPQSIADESFTDKVPDDKVSSRRRVVNDPELANTMDKYFQVIEEAAVDARSDNRTVCRMVVLKFLTRNVFDQCKYLLTRMDHGILNVIWPVILDQSRSVEDRLKQSGTFFEEAGIVVPDYESYSVFSVIILPVIKYLNGLDPRQPILPHPSSRFFEDAEDDVSSSGTTVSVLSRMELRNDEEAQRSMDLDPSHKMILHSVAHCTRNLEDYNLPQTLTVDELRQVERYLRRALLTGKSPYETKESGHEWDDLVLSDDEGTYYPLEELSDPLHDIRVKLRSAGQWLEQQGDPDRSMRLHGKYWPLGRGVFVTKDGNIAAYINVQDHLRVMVASKEGQGGKIGLVYRNLGEFMEKVDRIFKFKQDDIIGFLAARPWVCGNTLRFKVTVRLPKLGREPEHLVSLCKTRSLRLASAASLDVFHFSNRQCLGITEAQVYRSFVTAVANILQLEHRMEANGLHFTAILAKMFRKKRLQANAVR